MPVVKIKHIVSFSSEEPPHKADNLLNDDSSRKWKCATGEKQASIVFQLEKSTQLSSIDIANEGSAFIEVLVGRSSSDNVQYQVILVASSFMSPQESRQGSPPNRVRIFDKDKLVPDIASQKWDLVKVVCTQPFNKRCTYGLSFVKFHTLADDVVRKEPDVPVKQEAKEGRKSFGSFKMKEEKDDSRDFHPGMSMMMYHMAKRGNLDISLDEMSDIKTVGEARALIKEKGEQRDSSRRRSRSPDRKEVEDKRRKIDQSQSSSTTTPAKANPIKFDTLKKKTVNTPKTPKTPSASNTSQSKTPSRIQQKSNTPASTSKKRVKKPYNQILNGVIFVISGFQNPLRSELREKALGMGAQYRKDWTQDSTHLICAFPNTPKYRQVSHAGGKIVRKEWINDCASRKELVSWRNYNMGADQSSSSDEEEEEEKPTTDTVPSYYPPDAKEESEEEDPYEASTDEEAGDTEDEIEKAKAIQSSNGLVKTEVDDGDDPYNASTDEEPEQNNDAEGNGLPHLPDYFDGKTFMLYGNFSSKTGKLTRRHIIACGGKISAYMNEDVEYIVTEQSWDKNFDHALSENAALIFVRPQWLFQCGAQQRIVPYQQYVVSPS